MIRKIVLYMVLICTACFSVNAENVTRKQAQKIAETFFNASYGMYVAPPSYVWNGRQLTTNRLFSPFYVFNHPKGGYVIISSDSKAYPILAYSRTGKFDKDKLTEEEREWLKKFAMEIELIRYDSRSPEKAMYAWQNMPQYISDILENPYNSEEFNNLSETRKDILEQIDRRNNSVVMPSAVEFDIYDPDRYRDYTLDDVLAEADEYEVPFSFYENFIKEIEAEKIAREASLEEILSPQTPVVSILGGAHYSIQFPQNITLARIYSMQGARMQEKYYKDTNSIAIDISSLPSGFYALMVLGKDGKVYGLKLYR